MNELSGKGRKLVLDSEAIGLVRKLRAGDKSSMHIIVAKDADTGQVFVFFDAYAERDPQNREKLLSEDTRDGDLDQGIKFIRQCEVIISQNFSGYDALAFEKVFGKEFHFNYYGKRNDDKYPFQVMDTYVMSCVLNPERKPPFQAYNIGKGNVGPHSIEAHGIEIGRYKPENEDWSKLTDHMIHRCVEDVEIGHSLYRKLMGEWYKHLAVPNKATGLDIETAYKCELRVAFAIARQALRGFRFNTGLALKTWEDLCDKLETTEAQFRPHIPLRIKKKKLPVPFNGCEHGSYATEVKAITKKPTPKTWCSISGKPDGVTQKAWLADNPVQQSNTSGEFTASVTKRYPECTGFITDYKSPMVQGPFTPVVYEEVGLGSRDLIKQLLHKHGWLGVNLSDTETRKQDDGETLDPWCGKIDEDSIAAWELRGGMPAWCKSIGQWYVLFSRANQILNIKDMEHYADFKQFPPKGCKGLMAKLFNPEYEQSSVEYFETNGKWPTDPTENWRAPAEAFPNATNTSRMRHKVVVNIPSRGLSPLRDLFIASEGKKVLGCDGSGLELRMLAHFMNDQEYTDVVLNGDIHSYNQDKAGLPSRDVTKTFIYAFLYGSGTANLAKVCGMTHKAMEIVLRQFAESLPALEALRNRLEIVADRGYLIAVDGRQARIRSRDGKPLTHTLLNVLLQTTGSLTMKYGLCFADIEMRKRGVGLDETGHPAFVANVHDEIQMEVEASEVLSIEYEYGNWKDEEKRVHIDTEGRMWSAPSKVNDTTATRQYHPAGQILAEGMTKAGEFLKIRCPLAGEYSIGDSWADTH
jgi:hypothetical protein